MRVVELSQCGLLPHQRFSFYDQIHTTGMDIHQALNAKAVLTLGKDMTFRDYAQGAFRMRGIGRGQTIHLFIIPEVLRVSEEQLKRAGEVCCFLSFFVSRVVFSNVILLFKKCSHALKRLPPFLVACSQGLRLML